MANGELCKKYGYQESEHGQDYALLASGRKCGKFVSEFKHKRGCPVLDCEGDCDEMIKEKRRMEKDRIAQWKLIEH